MTGTLVVWLALAVAGPAAAGDRTLRVSVQRLDAAARSADVAAPAGVARFRAAALRLRRAIAGDGGSTARGRRARALAIQAADASVRRCDALRLMLANAVPGGDQNAFVRERTLAGRYAGRAQELLAEALRLLSRRSA